MATLAFLLILVLLIIPYLLSPGGVVFGDDFPWDSVANAVKAFCAEKGVPYQVADINWIIRKPV